MARELKLTVESWEDEYANEVTTLYLDGHPVRHLYEEPSEERAVETFATELGTLMEHLTAYGHIVANGHDLDITMR